MQTTQSENLHSPGSRGRIVIRGQRGIVLAPDSWRRASVMHGRNLDGFIVDMHPVKIGEQMHSLQHALSLSSGLYRVEPKQKSINYTHLRAAHFT